ncbi:MULTISPECIES: DegV family protein [unclassified Dehalobacter]|uniref:DegV family protein n=1 Tax=unclassified Dehalobacter TaxID=2635733 RepID=UPI000E6CE3AF|nr:MULTISPECIES: DegV family protein [unclassified Dehalobacter]RJE49280.1 fatty acid-binding protein DegV [Dehalobacter sp. MCB1]TCX53329.1 DegV family protein [Dehalobacter sp. 14DCB1]TCX54343.1 DegV family protein [Dehalobacter sp. 12DCB1]
MHIVTDSSADVPKDLLEKHCIHVVPLAIRVNGKEYTEGEDITPEYFYQEMYASAELPKTSQPAPAKFAQVFQELSGKGPVLCLTISSYLSGSFASANLGRELSGNAEVTIFDTLAGSLGHGLQVLKAVEFCEAGLAFDAVLSGLTKMRDEMKFLILLDTVENIVKGGRLSKFQGSLAKILDIKAILHNVDGRAEMLEKIRGRNKSLSRLIELVGERCSDLTGRIIGITHVDNLTDAQAIAAELQKRYHPKKIIINQMGATIATYAGKKGIIVAF